MNIREDNVWYGLLPIIILLVKRINPSQEYLSPIYTKSDMNVSGYSWCKCDICGKEMCHDNPDGPYEVREHYAHHLKESNLLPFI